MSAESLRAAKLINASAFAMAKTIAAGQPESNPLAGLYCALSMQAVAGGHSCLDLTRIAEQFPGIAAHIDLPDAPDADIFAGNALIANIDKAQAVDRPCLFVRFGNLLYLKKFWQLEFGVLEAIRKRLNDAPLAPAGEPAQALAQICLHKPLALLTGGPGTGKTTAISKALTLWVDAFFERQQRVPEIILCAPTGKAAARMNDAWQAQKPALQRQLRPELLCALPEAAKTLHRVLGINPVSRQARKNAANPLQADLLILDEASMIDLPLLAQVLQALSADCHLLLVGDPNQLPSIEAGNLLGSLMPDAGGRYALPALQSAHLHLQENYRQQSQEGLSRLARDCLLKPAEQFVAQLVATAYPQVSWSPYPLGQRQQTVRQAIGFYRELAACAEAGEALTRLNERIILTPLRGGQTGCETLNALIGRGLNAAEKFHGQAIMITENAPQLGLANGDTGLLWRHAEDQLEAVFLLGGELRKFPLGSLPAHEPAYVLTVHKAQGSEYGHVVLLLPEQDSPLLDKALVYTAITRCRASLHISADAALLCTALNRTMLRINGFRAVAMSLMEQEIQQVVLEVGIGGQ
ncbi:MAG: exodeoxyribonuclease V subunit alpha [Arenimonas sp.]|nr:exodeoxyribonuclease V subunit alpha [Arenimonas sp.]